MLRLCLCRHFEGQADRAAVVENRRERMWWIVCWLLPFSFQFPSVSLAKARRDTVKPGCRVAGKENLPAEPRNQVMVNGNTVYQGIEWKFTFLTAGLDLWSYLHTHTHTYMHTRMHTHARMHTHTPVQTHVSTCTHMCTHSYIHAYIVWCACVCTCMCVWIQVWK